MMPLISAGQTTPLAALPREFLDQILKSAETVKYPKGSRMILTKANRYCYLMAYGSASIVFQDKTTSFVLDQGSVFGHLPYVGFSDACELHFTSDSSLYRIQDEAILSLLLQDFTMFRSYMGLLLKQGLPLTDESTVNKYSRKTVLTIAGKEKSGRTVLTALLALTLANKTTVTIVDVSNSVNSVAELFGLERPLPLLYKQKGEESDSFDESLHSLELADGLRLINLANSGDTASDLVQGAISSFLSSSIIDSDIIIFDTGGQAYLQEVALYSDLIFSVEKNSSEKKLMSSWADARLAKGQRFYHVINSYFSSRKHESGALTLPELPLDATLPIVQLAEKIEMDNFTSLILGTTLAAFEPAFYASLAFWEQYAAANHTAYYLPGLSSFFACVFSISDKLEEAAELLSDFFKSERQSLIYKFVYPDEKLFSHTYVHSYLKTIFGDLRLEDVKTSFIVPLIDEGDTIIHRTTGRVADLFTALFCVKPWFQPFLLGDRAYRASEGMSSSLIHSLHYDSIHCYGRSQAPVTYPFKESSLMNILLQTADSTSLHYKADIIVDQRGLDLQDIRNHCK